MKKVTKIATVVMLLLAICIRVPTDVNAKRKNIFFPGEYRKKIAKNEYYVLDVDEYDMGNGIKRPFTISYYYKPSGGMHTWKSGKLKRIGTNRYKCGKMRFRVYKNKIRITKGGKYNGTYKVKIRY